MPEKMNFADRLVEAVEKVGSPVCVGFDPDITKLPEEFQVEGDAPAKQLELVGKWCNEVLEIVAPYVAAIKPQVARFECLHGDEPYAGMSIYAKLIRKARDMGILVIGDAKRGDIGSTAEAYADAHLRGPYSADALTVNGYFGSDGLAPFVDACKEGGKGLFILVRTSNPSGGEVQNFKGDEGLFYEHMARRVAELGKGDGLVGESGFSSIGAVVGATCPEEALRLRDLMPQQYFLLPGYGAQGASASDCVAGFRDKRGGIVNASRSVIFAHLNDKDVDWKKAVENAAIEFANDLASAVNAS